MTLVPDTMDNWTKKHTFGWLAVGASLGVLYNRIKHYRHCRTAGHQVFHKICCGK